MIHVLQPLDIYLQSLPPRDIRGRIQSRKCSNKDCNGTFQCVDAHVDHYGIAHELQWQCDGLVDPNNPNEPLEPCFETLP